MKITYGLFELISLGVLIFALGMFVGMLYEVMRTML